LVGWRAYVRSGKETPICAYILALRPSLKHLSLDNFQIFDWKQINDVDFSLESPGNLKPYSLLLREWLNLPDQQNLFDTGAITGLSSLVSINWNGRIAQSIFAQKALKVVELAKPIFKVDMGGLDLAHRASLEMYANHKYQ
jgi:hypothetical protein